MPLPSILIEGHLASDPEVKFDDNGATYVMLQVRSARHVYDDANQKWVESDVCFLRAIVHDVRRAENVAESLRKGDDVLLWGDLRTIQEGGVWRYEVNTTRAIGPSLRFRKTPHSRDAERAKPRSQETS